MASIPASGLKPRRSSNSKPLSKLAESLTRSSSTRALAGKLKRLLQAAFLRVQPASIRADGVDLAVMRDKAERLRKRPTGLRVGRVALVEDGKRSLECRVGQIEVEGRKLVRREQPFVDHRPRGK